MHAVWEAAVILVKRSGNVWDAARLNIVISGRIMIYNGGNRIFILADPYYNDTCKDSEAGFGRCAMLKMNILNISNFLEVVNSCVGKVCMVDSEGKRTDINKNYFAQSRLRDQYRNNKNCLRLTLEISNPGDYMGIVSYYAGDC